MYDLFLQLLFLLSCECDVGMSRDKPAWMPVFIHNKVHYFSYSGTDDVCSGSHKSLLLHPSSRTLSTTLWWNVPSTTFHSHVPLVCVTEHFLLSAFISFNPYPTNLFKFSPTWSCVSLPRPTTSSRWKWPTFVYLRPSICKSWCLNTHFVPNISDLINYFNGLKR